MEAFYAQSDWILGGVTTNLLGPIRMTSARLSILKSQPKAKVINVTSGLAFVPLAFTATYNATKAALGQTTNDATIN